MARMSAKPLLGSGNGEEAPSGGGDRYNIERGLFFHGGGVKEGKADEYGSVATL